MPIQLFLSSHWARFLLLNVSLALVGGQGYDSTFLSELKPEASAEVLAHIRVPDECTSPFGFSIMPYVLWQLYDDRQFRWKAVDELIIDDFHDDLKVEDLFGIAFC